MLTAVETVPRTLPTRSSAPVAIDANGVSLTFTTSDGTVAALNLRRLVNLGLAFHGSWQLSGA